MNTITIIFVIKTLKLKIGHISAKTLGILSHQMKNIYQLVLFCVAINIVEYFS